MTTPYTIELEPGDFGGDSSRLPAEFTFTAHTAEGGATLADVVRRSTWTSTSPTPAPFPPVRIDVGRWWCMARLVSAHTDGENLSAQCEYLTPWRWAYRHGEARPRRARVVRATPVATR